MVISCDQTTNLSTGGMRTSRSVETDATVSDTERNLN